MAKKRDSFWRWNADVPGQQTGAMLSSGPLWQNVGCCGYESTVSHLYDKAQSIITELHQILPTFEITYGNRSSAKLRDSSLLRFLASCKLFQHHLLGLVKIIREYLLFGLMPLVSFLGPKSKAVTKVAHS